MIEKLQPSNEQEINYREVYESTFIDMTKKPKKQPVCLSFGVKFNDYAPIVSYGNFACLVGASKSMKTFLKSALVAGYIGGNITNYFPDLRGHDTQDKIILDIDTEQGKYHAFKASKRVIDMVGASYDLYKPFGIRSLSPKERVEFIKYLFYESDLKNNIGFCSIDGVADLVDNVNDLDKSNEITNLLMKITEEKNIGLITVIHKNYDSLKPTGHLGSAVLKKAETVLFVDKNSDVAKVEPKYSRNTPIDEFMFQIVNNLPEQVSNNIFQDN